MIGACDVCNAQRVEVSRSIAYGIETFACSEGCDNPQRLVDCEACDGKGHTGEDEVPCGECLGLGEFIADAQGDPS